MGLAISKQLAELMGGSINVSSTPNEGSRFWITVPLPATEAPPQETSSSSEHEDIGDHPRSSLSILVAEDNPVNQVVVQAMLQKLGHDYKTVDNGKEAVTEVIANHDSYQIVLMDCDMPIKDGYQATREIRDYEKTQGCSRLTIIALTAHAVEGYSEISLRHGMDEHVVKPLQLEVLDGILSRFARTNPA